MRIAIAGTRSMVGSRLSQQLQNPAHTIVHVGRGRQDEIYLDLTERYRPGACTCEFDALVHCAASFEGDGLEGAVENELANAVGALRIAQLARDACCGHVILISSISALPESIVNTSYSLSKRHGQECLEWACSRESIAFTALQPSQLYDEYGIARRHQPLLYHIVDCARAGTDLTLYGKTDPFRNYLHISDLIDLLQAVLQRRIRGCFPVVHPQSHAISEVARMAFSVFGNGGKVVRRPDMPDISPLFIPDDTRIYALAETAPKVSLERGLRLIAEHTVPSGSLQNATAS